MSDNLEMQVRELTRQAAGLENGPLKVSLLEQAVALADVHQRADLGFSLRKSLIYAAYFGDIPEKALLAFSWRLAQCDRDPQQFPERDLLWEYKWIVVSCAGLPQIPRSQIDDLVADMTRRYQNAGFGLRAIYRVRSYLAMYAGAADRVAELFSLWRAAPHDAMSEDADCERNFVVEAQVYLRHYDKVLEVARPMRQGKVMWIGIRPFTMAHVLLALMHTGQLEEAMAVHRRGYPLVSRNPYYIEAVSNHILFLAMTDNVTTGIRIFEKHLRWAVESTDLRCRFFYYLAGRFLFERADRAGLDRISLRLPQTFPAFREDRRYGVSELAGWLDEACRQLAGRFDARNGTDWFSRQMAEGTEWHKEVKPYNLQVPAPGSKRP